MADTYNISDVFISYSRKDADFARRLFDKMKGEGREVWADWEDIPLTADWWSEIQAGIEGANTFVFIISPDSVTSDVCYKEIDHAVQSNKRIVPVLYREVIEQEHQDSTHPNINSHNWIFFTEKEDFDTAYKKLMGAMEIDLGHVREHTRLLVRAREWDNKGRDASLLLRGLDVNTAENWLDVGRDKQPAPTDLQKDFIFASRRARTAQQRQLLGGVSIALIIAIGLAILSGVLFIQSQENLALAETNEAVAYNAVGTAEQRGTAIADEKAISDGNLRDAWRSQALFYGDLANQQFKAGYTQRALLLAMKGMDHYSDNIQSTSAVSVLYDVLRAPIHATNILENTGASYPVWNSDKSLYMVWGAPCRIDSCAMYVDMRDTATGELLWSIYFYSELKTVQWSYDERAIITYDVLGDLVIVDATTGDILYNWTPESTRYIDKPLVFNGDGTQLAYYIATTFDCTENCQYAVEILDIGTLTTVTLPHDELVKSIQWNSNSTQLMTIMDPTGVCETDCVLPVQVWDAASGDLLYSLTPDKPVAYALWDEVEKHVITLSQGTDICASVTVWDAETGEKVVSVELPDCAYLWTMKWGPDGYLLLGTFNDLYTQSADTQYLYVMNIETGEVEQTYFDVAAMSDDGSQFATLGTRNMPGGACEYCLVTIWETTTGGELITLEHTHSVEAVLWYPEFNRILTITGSLNTGNQKQCVDECSVTVWDARSGDKLQVWTHAAPISTLEWNENGSLLLTTANPRHDCGQSCISQVSIWDMRSGRSAFPPHSYNETVDAWWSEDYRSFFVNYALCEGEDCRYRLTMADVRSGKETYTVQTDNYLTALVDTAKDLIITVSSDTITYWEPISTLPLMFSANNITNIAWNADQTQALTWTGSYYTPSQETGATVWDAYTGTNIYHLETSGSAYDAAWNADQSRIMAWANAEECEDACVNGVWMWDAATGDVIEENTSFDILIGAVWWSPMGDYYLVYTWDSALSLWQTGNDTPIFEDLLEDANISDVNWASENTVQVLLLSADYQTVTLWENGDTVMSIDRGTSISNAIFSPDGTQFFAQNEAICDSDCVQPIAIYSATDGTQITSFMLDVVNTLQWDAAGSRILAGYTYVNGCAERPCASTVSVWDAKTGEQIASYTHDTEIGYAAFNADQTKVISQDWDGDTAIWDATTGEVYYTIDDVDGIPILSPDEQYVAAVSHNSLSFVDVATGETFSKFPTDAAYLDGQPAIIWGEDSSFILHKDGVLYTNTEDLLERANALIVRDFTDDERVKFFLKAPADEIELTPEPDSQ